MIPLVRRSINYPPKPRPRYSGNVTSRICTTTSAPSWLNVIIMIQGHTTRLVLDKGIES